jgi:hypothetical protein
MNWLNIAIWCAPLGIFAMVGWLNAPRSVNAPLSKTPPAPPKITRQKRDGFSDSMIIAAATDSTIIGTVVGGDLGGALFGSALRDITKTPSLPPG